MRETSSRLQWQGPSACEVFIIILVLVNPVGEASCIVIDTPGALISWFVGEHVFSWEIERPFFLFLFEKFCIFMLERSAPDCV
jgi:hypothetical protein